MAAAVVAIPAAGPACTCNCCLQRFNRPLVLLQQLQYGWVLLYVPAAVGAPQKQWLQARQQLAPVQVDLQNTQVPAVK